MKLCHVSRDLYYHVLMKLDLNDINHVLMINKACYSNNDKFWQRKSYAEFSALAKLKPEWIDYMEWYRRLIKSGNLYRPGENRMLAQNVIKCIPHDDLLFYIDIFEDLYYIGILKEIERLLRMLDIKVDNINIHGQVKLKSHVKDFAWGRDSPVILTTDGVLSVPYNNKFEQLMTNVVAVFEQNPTISFNLILTFNRELHGAWASKNGYLTQLNIATNVKTATAVENDDENDPWTVNYINEDGQLWEYEPRPDYQVGETVLGKRPNVKINWTYERHQLLSGSCQDIQVTQNFFLILSNTNYLWIYSRDVFYTENKTDNDDDPNYFRLAGFSQDWYQTKKFRQVTANIPSSKICLVDFDNNFYLVDEDSLGDTPLEPIANNVISCSIDETNYYVITYRT